MKSKTRIVQSLEELTDEERRFCAWTDKGIEAYESTRGHVYTLFGGAKGGAKTVTGIRIIQSDISMHRDGVWIVIRKNHTVLHKTTHQSFERFFPPHLIVRKTAGIWYCVNGNEIWWWAADRSRDPNYEKTRGLEGSGIFVDEASEFDDQFYELLPSLLRRPAIHLDTGDPLPGYIYLTSNPVPGKNFLKRHFIDSRTKKRDGQHNFIRSLPDENPLLPQGYLQTAFSSMSGAMLQMLRFGDWDVDEADFRVIPSADFERVVMRRVLDRSPVACGIDIGLGRPDKTRVWCCNAAGEFWLELSLETYDTMEQARDLLPVCQRVQQNDGVIFIDVEGVGNGVSHRLAEQLDYGRVVPVTFGSSPVEEGYQEHQPKYENRRAQLYFWAREDIIRSSKLIAAGAAPILRTEVTDEFHEEVENAFYIPHEGKIRMEPKKSIKERLGHSPDDSDAWVLCNAARRSVAVRHITLPSRSTHTRTSSRQSITDGF